MDTIQRLKDLSNLMSLEPAEDFGCPTISARQEDAVNVSSAILPNGKRIRLLKTLLTSACERNCFYCPFRSGRDFRRTTLSPDEMSKVFFSMYRSGLIEGMFLSSGVAAGGIKTQDKILATADILRTKFRFDGYLHLKIMPGAEFSQVEEAMKLADRISINLEAPTISSLAKLAPNKIFLEELIQPIKWFSKILKTRNPAQSWNGRWPSLTTQFVVGAVGDSDKELLATTHKLTHTYHLSRAYYSAFHPVQDTPFETLNPTPLMRQNRLYQASYLLRDYAFTLDELSFDINGNLSITNDPKTTWAMANLCEKPIEINIASRHDLLHIPGFGPRSASAILNSRKKGYLRSIEDLRKIGVHPNRALPYILINGSKPQNQPRLF